jgi:ATP-dependent RNA helicase DeaD
MDKFKQLGINENILKALKELNFKEPTEIQEKVIPIALLGKDIIGESATGSGKTLAFGTSIIQNLNRENGMQALILVPTRELAEQVTKSLSYFSKYNSLRIVSIYGGVSLNPQVEALENANLVVGTPGRILDHLSRKTLDLSNIRFLVLDEADRMLDMGFLVDVSNIIDRCSSQRQTMLFSATISNEILKLSRKYMKDPVEVSVESYVDASLLKQFYYDASPNQKFSLLVHLLKEEDSRLVMVFCNTKRNADFIGNHLRKLGFEALALHGDLSQNKRNQVLEKFHKSSKFILVCTDVAARGLDIKDVSHVYNYDCPKTSIEYIHRIGRTARAGKEGKAITILSDRDYENFRRVLEDESLKITPLKLPEFEKVFIKMTNPKRNFRDGHRTRIGHNSFTRNYSYNRSRRNNLDRRSNYSRRNERNRSRNKRRRDFHLGYKSYRRY